MSEVRWDLTLEVTGSNPIECQFFLLFFFFFDFCSL